MKGGGFVFKEENRNNPKFTLQITLPLSYLNFKKKKFILL